MSTPNKICNDGASKLIDDGICEITSMLHNMSTTTEDNNNSGIANTCANCGKEGDDVNNTCNKCKMVKYCNAACKKKHRHKHKKDCEEHQRLAAECAAKLHDEQLFKQPPSLHEDCPICFQRMPTLDTGSKYKTCCGKMICSGCIHAVEIRDGGVGLCPFCRIPTPSSGEETVERTKRRIAVGDAEAIFTLGFYYDEGEQGLPQDFAKALDLYHQAAELGHASAYHNIGYAYETGEGVEVDEKKAVHYYELAAMAGNEIARHNLGCIEERAGNTERAVKHYTIAVRDGYINSLKMIKQFYLNGHATKEEYAQALRSYQEYLGAIKSAQRDEAAAADEDYKYVD